MEYYFTIDGNSGCLTISRGTAFDDDGRVISEVGDYITYYDYKISEAKKLYLSRFNLNAKDCVFARL